MADYLRNKGKEWTSSEISKIRELAEGNTPTRVIAFKIGRPVSSVYKKASENNISLAPPNQKPYNRS